MRKIFIPTDGEIDWKAFLIDPEKQWAKGYSARTLAHAWEDADGFPPEVADVFNKCRLLASIKPLLIFPEWKVPLPGGSTSSQNDIWVLAECDSGLVSITVEGKVNEPFDKTIGDWILKASEGKRERLTHLADILGLKEPIHGSIYYQLLHRTASAVIEAERFGATQAVMLVHSFSPTNKWFEEFRAFVALFKGATEVGKISTVKVKDNMSPHLAWVHGDERFLNA